MNKFHFIQKHNLFTWAVAASVLVGCSKDNSGTTNSEVTLTTTESAERISIGGYTDASNKLGRSETGFNVEDLSSNSTFANEVSITFNGNSATISNTISGVNVEQDNGRVVVTSTATGVNFIVSGTTSAGSLKIYSDKKIQLTLNNASITSNDGPAINIQSGKRAFVLLKENTTNTLTDSATYSTQYAPDGVTEEDIKGTLFSEGELLISGSGTLKVNGKYKHAITSDDYVRILEGNIQVISAPSHAIRAKDAVYIDGGTLQLTATKDGIQTEGGHIIINDGDITISAGDDGISAGFDDDGSGEPYLNINGGNLNITAKAEGLESKLILTINNGTINISSVDDAINARSGLYFNGGKTYAYATANDALDTNGKIGITGGIVIAVGMASAPETSVDATAEGSTYESGFTITGGYLVGIGRGNTPDTPLTSSSQKTIMVGSLQGSAGQIINLTSQNNKEILVVLHKV